MNLKVIDEDWLDEKIAKLKSLRSSLGDSPIIQSSINITESIKSILKPLPEEKSIQDNLDFQTEQAY